MNNLLYAERQPAFWLVRDEARHSYDFRREKVAILLVVLECLDEILKEDIRDGNAPHVEDLELLNVLKQGIASLDE